MTEELVAHVKAMDDAETFVGSDLGKIILGMAQQDAQAALEDFAAADVTNQPLVARLQQDIRVARRFEQYLIELIQRGREALASAPTGD